MVKNILVLADGGHIDQARNLLSKFFTDEVLKALRNQREEANLKIFNQFLFCSYYIGDSDSICNLISVLRGGQLLDLNFQSAIRNAATHFLWAGWATEICSLLKEIGEWHGLQARRADRYISSIQEINETIKSVFDNSCKPTMPLLMKKDRYKIFLHSASSTSSSYRYFSNDIRKYLSEEYDVVVGVEAMEKGIEADGSIVTGAMTNQEFANLLVSLGVDVFLDFCGENRGCRFEAINRGPVPIAITYCGLTSSGVPGYNFRLVDPVIARPEGLFEWSSEEILVHPTVFYTYTPPVDAPEIEMRQPDGPIVFGNVSQLPKISSQTIALWARILLAVPESCLLLKQKYLTNPGSRFRLRQLLLNQGVSADRIIFHGETSHSEHLAILNKVDIYLDTTPFGGHTTCCEAMWMGKPVVNLSGDSMVMGRLSGSLVTAAGYPQWVAATPDEYVAIAIDLAGQPAELARLRRELRGEMIRSPLCDGRRWVREFSDLLADLLARHAL